MPPVRSKRGPLHEAIIMEWFKFQPCRMIARRPTFRYKGGAVDAWVEAGLSD